MVRFRYGALTVVALSVASLGGKCDDLEDEDTRLIPKASGGAGGAGDGGGSLACAPAEECSVFAPSESGAECMAWRDNTNPMKYPNRRQMRSVWGRNTRPVGLATNPNLSLILDLAVELDFGQACNSRKQNANGGYILALDWDTSVPDAEQVAWVGYVNRVPQGNGAAARENGLCMAGFKYEAMWSAATIDSVGAPPFPPETWHVKPSRNRRVMQDFTVADVRTNRPLAEGEGIFYFNPEKYSIHGYAHTTYIVVNISDNPAAERDGSALTVVPIREPELRIVFNDASMNCAGRHRPEVLNAAQGCTLEQGTSSWGCKFEDEQGGVQHEGFAGKCAAGTSAAFVSGYFKIADLERSVTVLQETLCSTYAGHTLATEKGWGKFCSLSPDWGAGTANDPLRGGDWCSRENKASAEGGCIADSWKVETYLALQAFPIQPAPTLCAPNGQARLE